MDQPTITQTPSPGLFHWDSNGGTKGLKTSFMEKRRRKGCQMFQCQNLAGTKKMTESLEAVFACAIAVLAIATAIAVAQELVWGKND